jgi:hypothetical protein
MADGQGSGRDLRDGEAIYPTREVEHLEGAMLPW